MGRAVISVENLSKVYRLGEVGTGSLARDLTSWWANVRGKEDPNKKIGEKSKGGVHQALNNVSFQVNEGEVVGIIGRNGAGKSTLLKILSRITSPSSGTFKMKGRIASLLEVGTGFHPELTGRENIYLNGAILGMRKNEISAKFDEIVDFSEVEKFIDTPVKRYSSGMYVRLAFAVAAHLEPDILVVDEVLAVGDVAFQNKCMGKMSEVSEKQGRTILFVSHNMQAMARLCSRGIYLNRGALDFEGAMEEAIKYYLQENTEATGVYHLAPPENIENVPGYVTRIQVENEQGEVMPEVKVGEAWQISIDCTITRKVDHFIAGLNIADSMDANLNTSFSDPVNLEKGEYRIVFRQSQLMFSPGMYNFSVGLSSYERSFAYLKGIGQIRISDVASGALDKRVIRTSGAGLLLNPMEVRISKNNQ